MKKRLNGIILVILTVVLSFSFITCEDKDTIFDLHDNGHTFRGSIECIFCGHIYNIGDVGPGGGIIFYIDSDGFEFKLPAGELTVKRYYLEVSPNDLGKLAWDSEEEEPATISGLQEDLGYGRLNTTNILKEVPNAPAAKACNNYRGGGKADWFLPTIEELEKLYDNLDETDISNLKTDVNESYWSSTVTSAGAGATTSADFLSFNNGFTSKTLKTDSHYVRAIRAF